MTTPDKLVKPCPRNELNVEGEIVTNWVEAAKVNTFEEITKRYSSLDKKDLYALNEFSKALGVTIDHHLKNDTQEDREIVKQLIDKAVGYDKLTIYVGAQIHTILREEPKLISDTDNIPLFAKYKQALLQFNKEKKLITNLKERFID